VSKQNTWFMSLRPPRILIITHSLYNRAGVEGHIRTFSSYLADKYQFWITFPAQGQLYLRNPQGHHTSFPCEELSIIAPYHAPKISSSVQKIIEIAQPDIIHIMHFLGWHLGVIEQAKLSGINTVISFHDYFALTPLWTLQGEDDPLKVVYPDYALTWFNTDISKYLIDRRAVLTESINNINHTIVPSEFLATKLSVVFNNNFTIIPYGINPFQCASPKKIERANFRFGYLGALIPQKGWQVLVASFKVLQRDYPNTELHLFGGVQELPKSTDRIFYHGAFDEADLPVILSLFDVAIIPSIFPETFCIVLSEIWESNKVAAVSDIGALGHRVHDGVNGRKFRAGDVQSTTEILRWFLENDSWQSFKVPKPTYISECAAKYDSLYKEALKAK